MYDDDDDATVHKIILCFFVVKQFDYDNVSYVMVFMLNNHVCHACDLIQH